MQTLNLIWPDIQEVDKICEPSAQFFNEKFGYPKKPVIISSIMSNWKASQNWSIEYFIKIAGDQKLPALGRRGTGWEYFKLSEYASYMKTTSDENPYYLKNCKFHLKTSLQDDYKIPDYFKSMHLLLNELNTQRKGIFKLPKRLYPDVKIPDLSWIFIGAKGTMSGLHLDIWDTSAWNAVISGKKVWLFFPPNQSDYLYNGTVNPFHPDLNKYPYYAKTNPILCVQNAGEVVYTPSGWWHAVFNEECGISITENFINATNVNMVKEHFKSNMMFHHLKLIDKLATAITH